MKTPALIETIALASVLFASPIIAQQPLPTGVGTRLRVTAPAIGMHRRVGTLQGYSGDSMLVVVRQFSGDSTVAIPIGSISNLEKSLARHSNALAWGGRGLLVGGVIGIIAGLASGDDPPCNQNAWFCWRYDAEEKAMLGGVALGVTGGLLGLLAGAFNQSDNWQSVALARGPVAIGLRVTGGTGIGASISF